jgi:hypothetical protein
MGVDDRAVVPYRRSRSECQPSDMTWQDVYQQAARRHRDRASAARAARLPYQRALHERVAQLLESEAAPPAWRLPLAARPLTPPGR